MNRQPRAPVSAPHVIAPGAIDFEGPSAPEESDLAQWVRQELAGLPYYGVFDLLAFEVSDLGVVTLGGYVAHRPLKLEAEKGVTRVEGVAGVVNRIEVLPVSSGDDDLRRAVYRALYRAPSLSHYGTRLDRLAAPRPRYSGWGHDHRGRAALRDPRWAAAPFQGMEPVGDYPIHIIVRNGHVTLMGIVECNADRNFAGIRVNSVAGTIKVTNDLQVERET